MAKSVKAELVESRDRINDGKKWVSMFLFLRLFLYKSGGNTDGLGKKV